MSELKQLNDKMGEIRKRLEEIEKIMNFEYDVRNFTKEQRSAFAKLITPYISVCLCVKKALNLLRGEQK